MSKKKKTIYLIKIYCAGCDSILYEYNKEGPGSLVKCFVSGITKDHTKGDLCCPKCRSQFCRIGQIGARKIHKIIQGKVFTKGHCPK